MGRKPLFEKTHVLEVISRWIGQHGVPPTIRELAGALGVGSVRTAVRYLQILEEDGAIKRWSGARGMKPLRSPKAGVDTVAIPIVGEAPAGPLMTAEQNIEGYLRLPRSLTRPADARHFLLRVRGDSMNRANIAGNRIESGDLILARQQSAAQDGNIIVALVDGDATIKRFVRGPAYVLLKPESSNPAHHPVMVKAGFRILGVVQQVFKKGSDLISFVEE